MFRSKYTANPILDFAMTRHKAFAPASLIAIACTALVISGSRSPLPAATNGVQPGNRAQPSLLDTLVRLERGALERWIRLDPDGYLAIYAEEATYFDPITDKRLDGLAALRTHVAPIREMKAPFKDPRYEMVAPRVQRFGDAAILTFNLINYAKMGDQPERVLNRWNSTEVYARVNGKWKLVHSHWSYTKPEIKQPVGSP
jgi:uncharacterized protein (TIGR02246 family)